MGETLYIAKGYHKLLRTKDRENILKEAREKPHSTYREEAIQMAAEFSSEIMESRRK